MSEAVAQSVVTQSKGEDKRLGLGFWMQEVLDQCDKVEKDFGSDPVHDLRTALRRCRSLADGLRVFDPSPAWKKMKRAGKQLFSSLGELRDAHVMQDWVEELAPEADPGGKALCDFVISQEERLEKIAATALQAFDRKQWQNWADELPRRAAHILADSAVFAHVALERWQEAHTLHCIALRNRSKASVHELRIGLKRYRYTLENFLPSLHEAWGEHLKELQDLLGDVHDLDVLWQTAIQIKAFPDAETKARWRERILKERTKRLNAYREKMVGPGSLWPVWRAGLPKEQDLRDLALARLEIWAAFLDPSVRHSKHVAELALQLYDGLAVDGVLRGSKRGAYRYILQAATMMHDIGRAKSNAGHHKTSARMIRKLTPPLGWTADEIRITALVARYHRGALPKETQKRFAGLSQSKKRLVQFLGGLLRLACACDEEHDGQIRRIEVASLSPVLTLRADGYSEASSLAERLAAARHLLELAYHRPVFILPLTEKSPARAA